MTLTPNRNGWNFFNGVGIRLQELVLKRKKQKMHKLEQKTDELQIKLDPLNPHHN